MIRHPEVDFWIEQSKALDAVVALGNTKRYRVLSYLAETAPAELLAAIEKANAL